MARPGSSSPMGVRTEWRNVERVASRRTWVLAMAVAFGAFAAALGWIFSDRTNDLWFEVAKAGIQVVAVGVVGGGLATVWRRLGEMSARIDEVEHSRRDRLASDYSELATLYNQVKAIRRRLGSLGLDLKQRESHHPLDATGGLT